MTTIKQSSKVPKNKGDQDEMEQVAVSERTLVQELLCIDHHGKNISACLTRPNTPSGYALILTHGAGGDANTPYLVAFSEHMARKAPGLLVLRFTCKGGNVVYRSKVYYTVLEYLAAQFKGDIKGCFLAGRSMGSRAAVMVANRVCDDPDLDGFVVGVLALSYPLHRPKDTHNLRDEPLKSLRHPSLYVSGTNDEMADRKLMGKTASEIPADVRLYWIDGADHGHKVKRRSNEDVMDELVSVTYDWCQDQIRTRRQKPLPKEPRKTLDARAAENSTEEIPNDREGTKNSKRDEKVRRRKRDHVEHESNGGGKEDLALKRGIHIRPTRKPYGGRAKQKP